MEEEGERLRERERDSERSLLSTTLQFHFASMAIRFGSPIISLSLSLSYGTPPLLLFVLRFFAILRQFQFMASYQEFLLITTN